MLKLEDREWKPFGFEAIFTQIGRGKRLKKDDHVPGVKPYVSSTSQNNGVDGFIGNDGDVRIYENCLTLANSGSVGSTFYQPYSFIASDHVTALKNTNIDEYAYKFLASLMSRLEEKYSFNREINDARIRREQLLLPVDAEGSPDWGFMSAYMREQEKLMLERVLPHFQQRLLNNLMALGTTPDTEWGGVILSDLFLIRIGKNLDGNKIDKLQGVTPYVTRKETNNGIDGFTDGHGEEFLWTEVPAITIGNETARPFVQTAPFYTGTKVNILIPEQPLSTGVLKFIARCLEANKERYSYSYTANSSRLAAQRIMLPLRADGTLNIDFMEQTIAKLEADQLSYLTNLLQTRYDDLVAAITLRGGELTDKNWGTFRISSLLPDIYRGLNDSIDTLGRDGSLPYVGAAYRNNGVTGFVSCSDRVRVEDPHCIVFVLTGEGSVGFSFYKSEPFVPSKNVAIGRNEHLNRHSGNFLVQMINSQASRYNYGYIRSMTRLKREQVMLPIGALKAPDWDFMSDYMRAQESLALLQQLRYMS